MKSYPSIPSSIQFGLDVHAFNKIDGSNIRAEWDKKLGFHKFGSRKRLLGDDQAFISKARNLILEQQDIVANICEKNRWESIILFYEFAGPNSSFGNHVETDEHQVYLIDANPYKKGILLPEEFVNKFEGIKQAELLYTGECNEEFVNSVKNGTLLNMSDEGVVCKAKGKGNTIMMFKIKCDDWYSKLKIHCNGNEKLFNELK